MEQHPVLESVEQRVRYIAELMSEDRWVTKRCQRELAAVWSVTPSTVRNYSAEAHRILALDPEHRAKLRTKLEQRMEQQSLRAFRLRSQVTGLPDFGGAAKLTELQAKFAGLLDDEKAAPAPPTIVIEYAGPVQPSAVGDAPGDAAGVDGRDPVGPRSR
jgi:hypothetical protein